MGEGEVRLSKTLFKLLPVVGKGTHAPKAFLAHPGGQEIDFVGVVDTDSRKTIGNAVPVGREGTIVAPFVGGFKSYAQKTNNVMGLINTLKTHWIDKIYQSTPSYTTVLPIGSFPKIFLEIPPLAMVHYSIEQTRLQGIRKEAI